MRDVLNFLYQDANAGKIIDTKAAVEALSILAGAKISSAVGDMISSVMKKAASKVALRESIDKIKDGITSTIGKGKWGNSVPELPGKGLDAPSAPLKPVRPGVIPENIPSSLSKAYDDAFKAAQEFFEKNGGSWRKSDGAFNYPPNNGFLGGVTSNEPIPVGTVLDRYSRDAPGDDTGKFLSPAGTPYEQRSLPGQTAADAGIYTQYRVLKPIDGKTGIAAPWFGQLGGAPQHMTNMSIQDLIKYGYLEIID